MVKVRQEKIEKVRELKEKLDSAKAFYLCNYTGLTVAEITELRRRLREKGAILKVVKNTTLYFALKEKNLEDVEKFIPGPTAVLFAMEDEIEPLKAAFDYSKEISKFSFKAGWLDGKIFGPEEINIIAKLPTKKELQAQVVGALNAPIFKLVYSLNWPIQALVFALEQIRKQKEEVK
ncbi:MAG: 50S ribosomal protein L10 [bacterium]|nr:50S ribosomal protein L10 [bacterium]